MMQNGRITNSNVQGNMQRRRGKPPLRGGGMNLERLLNQPRPKHGTKEAPATHLWKDCHIMRESDLFRYDQGPSGGSGPGFHGSGYGGGDSSSGFQNHQGNQNNQGGNHQQGNQGSQQQSGYQSNPKQLNSGQYHVFTTSLDKRDQKLH